MEWKDIIPDERGFHYEGDDQDHETARENGDDILPLHFRGPTAYR
jgi:hypothetical protein